MNRETASEIERQWELLSPVWLFNPTIISPPGSSVLGISQAVLEWVAIPFSRGSSLPGDWIWVSCNAVRFFIISNQKHQQQRKSRNRCLHYLILSHSQWRINANIFQTLSKDRKGGNNCKLILHRPDMEIRQGHLKKRKL